jgi:hypothetical protein
VTATARIHLHGSGRGEELRWATRNPLRRRRLRQEADRLLRAGVTPRPGSLLLATRAAELTSARERRLLARSLHAVLRELSGTTLPGPSPLNRAGIRPYASELAAIAVRLGDAKPVSARGILLVRDLLTSPDSPLYAYDGADELPSRVDDALAALDGD